MVVAVGGNALTLPHEEGTAGQIETNAGVVADGICALHAAGWRVVIVHGNGPQVGNLAIQQEAGTVLVPPQPLHSLVAMSQGQLGSVLVRAIDARLGPGAAVAVVSHVTVDPADPAFAHPTKPIGPFFSRQRSTALASRRGWTVAEDSGRGYRRVVPSARPVGLVESDAIKTLVQSGKVVLVGGGGGVPVSGDRLVGVDAVIDKDRAAARVAVAVGASALVLVTGADAVMVDFGTPHARAVTSMTVADADRYLAEGQFPPGSMGPKIEAVLDFLRSGGEMAVVTSAERLAEAVEPGAVVGTHIVPTPEKLLA
jgi:carbamate kinase